MSSSSDGLQLANDNPTTVLSSVSKYLANGGKIVTLLSTFIFGIGASLFVGVGKIINAVVDLITTPFTELAGSIAALMGGLLEEPAGVLEKTAQASAQAIAAQFGWLALPVGVAVVLVSIYMVVQYLEQPETGDTIVGLPFDTPDIGPFEIGVTEEGEDESGE